MQRRSAIGFMTTLCGQRQLATQRRWRLGSVDPRTLALVYRIQVHFGAPEIRVVSGYRVPKPGSHSNHGKGRAMDLVVPGVADEDVARFARGLGFVGVGVYPTS